MDFMDFFEIFWITIVIIIIVFLYFLYIFWKKLDTLEQSIIHSFQKRTHLIPSLYDISKDYIWKHTEVFDEILQLRKQEIYWENDFIEEIVLQSKIHHELNFIFTVVNKHPQVQKNGKYLLLKDLFIENSAEIWEKMILYKKMVGKYNFFLRFKNITIIGIVLNFKRKKEI